MQQTENSNPEPRTSNFGHTILGLLDYLTVIFKHRRVIFSITLVATIITVIYTLFLPNIYTAKTLILPAQEDRSLMSAMMGQLGGLVTLAGGVGATIGSPTSAELYVSMLKSEAVKYPVIERFNLMNLYGKKYMTDASLILDKKTSVSIGKKDGIITITFSDKDPKRAAALANAYVEELGHLAIRLNVVGAGQSRTFLEERLGKAKAELLKAEDKLKSFQTKNKSVSVTVQAEASIKGIAELRAQLASQEVQLATYRRQFTDSSQEVKNLATSVGNLRAQISKLEGAGGNSAIPSVGSMPGIGQEYVRLMREFKVQESLVEMLTKQYEMSKLSEAKDVSPFQVILEAKVPERKSKPHRAKLVIISIFVSFVFSVSLVLLYENFIRMDDEKKILWKNLLKVRG